MSSDSLNKKSIIKRLKAIEATAQMLLDEATAIRKELEGGASSSPEKGKRKAKAVATVLAKRRSQLNN